MSRYNDIIIGDVHAQVSNLEDAERLMALIEATALERKVQRIIFMGDLFHTHAVIRQEVAHFYRKWMARFKNLGFLIWIVVGNHDGISPSNSRVNACSAVLSDLANVCSHFAADNEYVYAAFMYSNDEFVTDVNNYASDRVLLCHQTFLGAAYESGMPVPEGVDASAVKFNTILAGHIHKAQLVQGKVLYIGTPRAITAGEANESKYIYHATGESPATLKFDLISTDAIVKRFFTMECHEMKVLEMPEGYKQGDDVRITVTGNEEYYAEFLKLNAALIGKVKFIPKITKKLDGKVSIEETGGDVRSAMKKYVLEVADVPDKIKERVWLKVSALI